jgi:hypothetical protein
MRRQLFFALSALALATGRVQAAEALVPDLIAWKRLGTYMFDARIGTQSGRRVLQFSSAFANVGRGPFELRGTVTADGRTTAYQRVYNSDGSFNDYFVGSFVFEGHGDHNHFHYAEFAAYRLRRVTSSGGVGSVAAASDKVGFAMWDVTRYDTSLPGAPARAVYEKPEGMEDLVQGISVGWADVYDWNLWDQNIDLTGVPDGDYWLENEMDPNRHLRDADLANNISRIKLRIRGDSVVILPDEDPTPPPANPPTAHSSAGPPSPNPWRSDRHAGLPMHFDCGPGGVIKIFSLTGRVIRTFSSAGGGVNWDLTDENGGPVRSGFYLYLIEDPGGGTRQGRFAVVR